MNNYYTGASSDEKIKKQQQSDLVVPPEFEIRLLLHQVNLDLNDNQFDQAINKYYALLNLMAAEDDKDTYRREIIKLVLNHTDDQNLLSRGLEALKQLLNRPAASAALLNEIQSVCDQYRTDDKLLLPSAKIIIELIIPPELNELLSPDLQKNWDNRRRVVALKIITQQQELLAGDNPQRNNPQAIQLLRQLVQSQLKDLPDFPAGQAPQIRLEWLSAAAKLIQGYVPF